MNHEFCMRPNGGHIKYTYFEFISKINCVLLTCVTLVLLGHVYRPYNAILLHSVTGVLKLLIGYKKYFLRLIIKLFLYKRHHFILNKGPSISLYLELPVSLTVFKIIKVFSELASRGRYLVLDLQRNPVLIYLDSMSMPVSHSVHQLFEAKRNLGIALYTYLIDILISFEQI